MDLPLDNGEYQIGSYKVQKVNWEDGDWHGTGYWLRAVVTNRRIALFPERHSEVLESIFPAEIVRAWNVCLRGRDGVMLRIEPNQRLYMLVDWSQGARLAKDIQTLMTPPARPRIHPRLTTPA